MIKPEDMLDYQTVYFEEPWSGNIIKATVHEYHTDYMSISCVAVVDPDGNEMNKSYGNCNQAAANLFASAQEAYTAKQEKFQAKVDKYCSQMITLADVLAFPIMHNVGAAEEYSDLAAQFAYKKRCKELYPGIVFQR